MRLKQKLPVSYLLFTFNGRISRGTYWLAAIFYWCSFYILYELLLFTTGEKSTFIIYPLLFWAIAATSTKRLHDQGKSGYWLALMIIPVLGPLWLFYKLGIKKGNEHHNFYGSPPGLAADYHKNDDGILIHPNGNEVIINDVTKLNPIVVSAVKRPNTVAELIAIIKQTPGKISVGGGRFSMGGQTASEDTTHIDMRGLNKVIEFSKADQLIKVQAGIRWCDIQQYIDPHELSVKTMQTYANFTVGGALSVNAHGRYIGLGPIILSVKSIDVVLADGTLISASSNVNQEIFYAAIGGYNTVGIIVEAELYLANNTSVKRIYRKMKIADYKDYFFSNIRDNTKAIFHNGDIYPPKYKSLRAVTWAETTDKPTVKTRLMPLKEAYPIERYFLWSFTETPFGKWRREYLIDPLIFRSKKVHWRNYEAGYDVAELEPRSRTDSTYVLLEYFVPIAQFEQFATAMAEIFQRYGVNVLNVSIRHAKADVGSYLAWARSEVFAFVVYYKQRTNEIARNKVAIWTRELADAVIAVNGAFYLPYQIHATSDQFHKAYPNANLLFKLKDQLDPNHKFNNKLLDAYLKPSNHQIMTDSKFKTIYSDTLWSDKFYKFLQVVFHLYPEDKFHQLIKAQTFAHSTDEEIYVAIQKELPKIKPFLSELTYALPALRKQKKEIARQTILLLGDKREINGYAEIGSTGRYVSQLRKEIKINNPIYILNDDAPTNSPADLMERGQFAKIGKFIPINYEPIAKEIANSSLDLVTCYIGLHHCPIDLLERFIQSIHRILRPGGAFIIRDHDVKTPDMATFVSLVHTVFNVGLKETLAFEAKDFKNFKSAEEWSKIICKAGFKDSGERILQDNDPSDNVLMLFIKL